MENNNLFSASEINEIVRNSLGKDNFKIKNVIVRKANEKMLGFLGEYWRLKIIVNSENNTATFHLFVKSIARSNANKAKMIKQERIFEKETAFYTKIKSSIEIKDEERWCAKLIAAFEMDMVFEDLLALGFKSRDRFQRFDIPHCKAALKTLARFHSRSIIYEEKQTLKLGKRYSLWDEYQPLIDKANFTSSNIWYIQCREAAYETLRSYSKYSSKMENDEIQRKWTELWNYTLDLCEPSKTERNVVCHHDLWNNNILFHYDCTLNVDGCVLVDFQATHYHPPAGDVMMLLYCNLDPFIREANMISLLNFYYDCLGDELESHQIEISNIITKNRFFECAEEYRKWGLLITACLLPQFWIDDDFTTETFEDSAQFQKHLLVDKATFIKSLIETRPGYKAKLLEIFEDLLESYVLCNKDH